MIASAIRCRNGGKAAMKKAILATKVGMTQIFADDGSLVPVTVLQAGPCVVTQVKTKENDGYSAVQVGFAPIREKLVNKPQKGAFDKAGVEYKRYLREFAFENAEEYEVKQEIKADIFAQGDHVDATAISKGHGFQGAIKKWGQHRGPMKHGSKYHRHAGSNGPSSDPSRVAPGKHMAGRMGREQVTVQNLVIVRVDAEKNLILVKGAVPGPKKSLVTLKETTRTDLK
jgi:large subunit ribosomal protein L3